MDRARSSRATHRERPPTPLPTRHETGDPEDDEWGVAESLAPGVAQLELAACRAALSFTLAFRDIASAVTLDTIRDGIATLSTQLDDPLRCAPPTVPTDVACTLANRIAREVFDLLPVRGVTVNVTTEWLHPETGQLVHETILGARFVLSGVLEDQLSEHAAKPAFLRRVKSSAPPFDPDRGCE